METFPPNFCSVASSAIELESVSLAFGPNVVLENLSLNVKEGESLVLVGPSGQGKTSLLKLMAGLIPPSKGEVRVNGVVGMLFQKNALFDSMSVLENILFPLRETTRKTPAEQRKIALSLLDAVDLIHAKDLFPHEISGGMQKRLGLARALALKPEILLYDDPTAGLDPITGRKIAHLLKELTRSEAVTTITVTNDMMRALQLADRIGFVWNRSVQIIGSPDEAKNTRTEPFRSFLRGEPFAGV